MGISRPDPTGAEPTAPSGPSQAALPRATRRVGVGVSAVGGLGAVVGVFLPWLIFVAAIETGCRGQVVQVELYNLYGAAIAIGNAGDTAGTMAIVAALCAVAIFVLAMMSAGRLVLFRIRLLVAASLVALTALGLFAVLAIGGQVTLIGKSVVYSALLGFGVGYWVTTGSLALALVGGAVLHAAARPLRQRAPIGEIALAALGILGVLSSTTAAAIVRPAPYPSLACAQQGSAPFSPGGAIYFTTADRIYALDEASGRVQWRCNNPLGGVVMSAAPALAEGVLYVASFDGYVYAIHAENAAILWRADVGGRGVDTLQAPLVAPFVADGLVYGVNGAGQVYALRTSDGAPAWPGDVARPAVWRGSTPLLVDGALIYPAIDAGKLRVTALDERTGQRRWQAPDNCVIFPGGSVPLLPDQSAVYVEETSAKTGGVYLVARSVADGVARWRYAVSAPDNPIVASVFTVADGVVYLELRQGETPSVVALRADDGAVMWRTPAPDVVSGRAAPAQPMTPLVGQTPYFAPTPTPPSTPSPFPIPTPQLTPTPWATQEPNATPTLTSPPMTTLGAQAQVTLAADRDGVYVAVSAVPGDALNTIYRFDARHGAVVWRLTFAHHVTAASYTMYGKPAITLTGDSVYLLDPSGTVATFDAHTGATRWQLSSEGLPSSWSPMPGAITVGDTPVGGSAIGLLYVATSKVYALNPSDGAVRWQFTPDTTVTPYALRLHPLTPVISPPTLAP